MTGDPTVHLVDAHRFWAPIPYGRALAWSRAFTRWVPLWPGAAGMWVVSSNLKRARPAGITEWAEHARAAESAGFTPKRYGELQLSLDRLWPDEFASHPDNDLDRRTPTRPVRRFDVRFWSAWPALVDGGATPDEATALLLTVADAGSGTPPAGR